MVILSFMISIQGNGELLSRYLKLERKNNDTPTTYGANNQVINIKCKSTKNDKKSTKMEKEDRLS